MSFDRKLLRKIAWQELPESGHPSKKRVGKPSAAESTESLSDLTVENMPNETRPKAYLDAWSPSFTDIKEELLKLEIEHSALLDALLVLEVPTTRPVDVDSIRNTLLRLVSLSKRSSSELSEENYALRGDIKMLTRSLRESTDENESLHAQIASLLAKIKSMEAHSSRATPTIASLEEPIEPKAVEGGFQERIQDRHSEEIAESTVELLESPDQIEEPQPKPEEIPDVDKKADDGNISKPSSASNPSEPRVAQRARRI